MKKEFIYPVRICKIEGKIENSESLLSKNEYFVKRKSTAFVCKRRDF